MYKFEVGKVYKSSTVGKDHLYKYQGLCKDYDGNMAYQFSVLDDDKNPIYGICVRSDLIRSNYNELGSEAIIFDNGMIIIARDIIENYVPNISKSIKIMKGEGCLRSLNIKLSYIKNFKKYGKVTLFEHYEGFTIDKDLHEDLYNKIKEIETNYNVVIYAVTHEFTYFGECYSFLCVSDCKSDWRYTLYKDDNYGTMAIGYVWNVTCEDCSEFGEIVINSKNGGIARVI